MAKIVYARVSSQDQNMDRQIEQLKEVDKLFQEAMSGASKERPQLKAMLNYIREGDRVVVTELGRLGRNNKELTEVMNEIQTKGATLEVLNLPTLRGIEDDNLRRLLNNLVLELYKLPSLMSGLNSIENKHHDFNVYINRYKNKY